MSFKFSISITPIQLRPLQLLIRKETDKMLKRFLNPIPTVIGGLVLLVVLAAVANLMTYTNSAAIDPQGGEIVLNSSA